MYRCIYKIYQISMKNCKLVILTTVVVVILKRNVTRCLEIYSVVNQNVQVYLDTSQ